MCAQSKPDTHSSVESIASVKQHARLMSQLSSGTSSTQIQSSETSITSSRQIQPEGNVRCHLPPKGRGRVRVQPSSKAVVGNSGASTGKKSSVCGGLARDSAEQIGSITMTSVKSEVEMAGKPETCISPKPEPVIVASRDVNCSPSFLPSRLDKVNHRSALQIASFPVGHLPPRRQRGPNPFLCRLSDCTSRSSEESTRQEQEFSTR